MNYPSLVVEDDFFFYLKTATNLWNYGFVTFDGINPTNGIHPLYFIFSSLVYFFIDLGGITEQKIAFFIYSALYFSLIYSICSYLLERKGALILFMSLILCGIYMETVILGLLFCLFSIKRTKVLIFFIVFCRIDSLIILLPYLIYKLFNCKTEALSLLGPILLGVLGTLIFNFLLDGMPISISSFIKMTSDFSIIDKLLHNLSSELFLGKLLFAIAITIPVFKILKKQKDNIGFFILLGLCIFVMMHLFFSIFRNWYLAPLIIFCVFILYKNLNEIDNAKIKIAGIVSVLILSIFVYIYHDLYLYNQDRRVTKELISEIKKYRNKTGYMVDASGFPAYFSGVNIINGDGLINSFEFYNYKKQNLEDYFIKYGYPDFLVIPNDETDLIFTKDFYKRNYCFSWAPPETKKFHKIAIYKACNNPDDNLIKNE
jgi:hypothetical protein